MYDLQGGNLVMKEGTPSATNDKECPTRRRISASKEDCTMTDTMKLTRIESAASDALRACEGIQAGGDESDARILLEAAQDVYMKAVDVASEALVSRILGEVAS